MACRTTSRGPSRTDLVLPSSDTQKNGSYEPRPGASESNRSLLHREKVLSTSGHLLFRALEDQPDFTVQAHFQNTSPWNDALSSRHGHGAGGRRGHRPLRQFRSTRGLPSVIGNSTGHCQQGFATPRDQSFLDGDTSTERFDDLSGYRLSKEITQMAQKWQRGCVNRRSTDQARSGGNSGRFHESTGVDHHRAGCHRHCGWRASVAGST